ncbi:MAG TPA: alpha/beta hydrolase [Acidimicrobiales bacterium]|nr:alpha/beta hydrolase [Acidimicrobiales bacterium]
MTRRTGVAAIGLVASVVAATVAGPTGSALIATATAGAQVPGDIPTEGRYFEPVFDDMETTEDIVYGQAVNVYGETQDLHLDIYEPAGDTVRERPVLVLLHGGSFVLGNHKSDAYGAGPGVARTFVELGYVVVSPQYRLRPEMPFAPNADMAEMEAAALDAHDDISAALAWLRGHAGEYRIDPDAIVPFGFSAGGTIAWNLAWVPGSSLRPDSVDVPAAVSVAGAPFETSVITGEPLAAPTAGDAPVLAYHGDADAIVSYEFAAGPCGRAAAAGVRCDLITFEGVGHPSFDPAFVPLLTAEVDVTLHFLAEEVLVPFGYVEVQEPPDPPEPLDPPVTSSTTVPITGSTATTVPDGGTVRPVAQPARPVAGQPDYTG